jgi:hypothetical protein
MGRKVLEVIGQERVYAALTSLTSLGIPAWVDKAFYNSARDAE